MANPSPLSNEKGLPLPIPPSYKTGLKPIDIPRSTEVGACCDDH